MFAARVGKTTIAEMLLLCSVATAPASFLFGTSTETLAKQTVRKKLWPTFEQCEITREWCPAEHNRVQNRIDLRYCTGYVAWSGSPTTLADIGPRYSHANEVSKWTRDVSDEADPLELFRERGSEIPNRKMVGESTPTIEGGCRIYRELLAGTNERYHVPCPHCGAYQELLLGDGTPGSGGLIWDKTQDGNASPDLAGRTARYQCAACKREIGDEYKPGMTARGVWCPDGCAVDQRGKLQGTPLRSPYSRSFQLSRLYAPTFTFGDVARAFVRAAKVKSKEPELLRNFMNSWLGWPWREREQSRKWSEVAGRLCVPGTICRPPREAIFLTAGVDRQIDKLVYFVAAWGLGGRGWLVDYGNADTWADLLMTLDTTYIREDGREMGVLQTLVDSKFQQDQVDEFCRKNDRPQRRIWPSQGAKPGQLQGQSYRLGMIDKQKEAERKRGREVQEFLEDDLGPDGLARSVVIVATGDEPALMRRQAAYLTLAVAEYFRNQGRQVLCLIDSVTRFAMAQREIGLSAGEPPTSKGYPPTTFGELARLLERAGAGTAGQGAITGLFSVLVEGDDHNEPISDSVRGILDGHIVMDRKIADRGRYPAIDILKSISRSMPNVFSDWQNGVVRKAKQVISTYEDMAELIRLGAYRRGTDPAVDEAVRLYPQLEAFLTQNKDDSSTIDDSFSKLAAILGIKS